MKIKNEFELIESKDARNKYMDRVDILEKVKDLILLTNTSAATTQQVADYYEVTVDAIKMMVKNNKDEFEEDGYKLVGGKHLKEFLVSKSILPTNHKGYFVADGQRFAYKSNALFTKRAMLRAGMLLRDSPVAKTLRTMLLNVVHDTQEQAPEIIDNVVNEISQEQEIYLRLGQAISEGNIEEILKCNGELNQLKNKRIEELETENQNIREYSLTITDSKKVINRIVRTIATLEYHGSFQKAYSDLYTQVNYKLGINLNARKKDGKNKSLLSLMTDQEIFETELIARCWASEKGLDTKKLLKLA